jgi:hypothetical protein
MGFWKGAEESAGAKAAGGKSRGGKRAQAQVEHSSLDQRGDGTHGTPGPSPASTDARQGGLDSNAGSGPPEGMSKPKPDARRQDHVTDESIISARDAGMSWAEVSRVTGLSRSGARQRYLAALGIARARARQD